MTPPVTTAAPATVPFARDLAAHGDAPALLADNGTVTYADLARRVAATADRLGPVRRLVLLAAENRVEAVVTYLAALSAGHPVLLAPGDRPQAVDALVATYRPDVVVGASTGWQPEERHPTTGHDLHPDLALLLCTSGSTGSAKVVRLSHGNLQANAAAIASYLRLGPADRAVTSLPLHYCYGLSVLHSHLAVGAGVVLTTASVVDPCFWRAVRDHGVTGLAGVPYTFDLLDRAGFDRMALPSLRYVTQAGGRLAPERVRHLAGQGARRGWELFVMYGQTEATARMAYLPPELAHRRPEAVGVPIPGGSFTLAPVHDHPGPGGAAPGPATAPDDVEEGELVYRGPNVMLGYAEDPGDLALGRTVHELRTGDLARRGPDGLVEVVGRLSRFVKLFGLRVDLARVEQVLADHGVRSVCTGDDRRLVVAVTDDVPVDHVRSLVRAHVGVPAGAVQVVPLPELPRLANGKPDLAAVLAAAPPPGPPAPGHGRGGAGADPTAVGAGGTAEAVRALYQDVLQVREVPDDATFVGLGGDSLSYVEVSIRLEAVLGDLPPAWHLTPVAVLAADGAPHRRRLRRVETNVVLRAVAIVAIVGTHTDLFLRPGGAHVLLGIAGYNFARFQLSALEQRGGSVRPMLTSAARVAVPTVVWMAGLLALSDDYALDSLLLVNVHGASGWDRPWRYWFVEGLVHVLVVLSATFAIPAVRRAERRRPYAFALGAVGLGLLLRFQVVSIDDGRHLISRPQTTFWIFALGWAAARAGTTGQRLVVSAVAVWAMAGYFDDPVREALVAGGLLLLQWVPGIRAPAPLARLLGALAAASLYTYLTHWGVYPPLLEAGVPSAVALGASLAVGWAAWWSAPRVAARGARSLRAVAVVLRHRVPGRPGAASGAPAT